MKRRDLFRLVPLAALAAAAPRGAVGAPRASFDRRENALDLLLGQTRVATYFWNHPEIRRPGFMNLASLGGRPVTRPFPARVPEDATPGFTADGGIDHRLLHPGLWLSFGDLDGEDFWRLRALTEHVRFAREPAGGGFAVEHRYLRPNGREVCRETATFGFHAAPDGWSLRWRSEFQGPRAFYFGDQDEMGLGIRVASPLRVKGGTGTIRAEDGRTDEAGTWGRPFRSLFYGTREGVPLLGVRVTPAAGNPCWAHSRDYGVVVANPFPRNPAPDAKLPAHRTWVEPGETFRLEWEIRVLGA
jgi:hypothetical protein